MFEPKVKEFTPFLKGILFKNVIGVTLCPFGIFVKDINKVSHKTINHENIHWQQQLEMLIVFFYILYFVEWVIKMCFMKDAYMNLSFEREAYNNDINFDYLATRKPYAWIKYIFH